MKKLLVLAMSLGLVLAMPMAVGATQPDSATEDFSWDSDMPYDGQQEPAEGEDKGNETTEEETTVEEEEFDEDLAYKEADPTKSPKTGDTSRAGAMAAVVVIAGGVAYFAG